MTDDMFDRISMIMNVDQAEISMHADCEFCVKRNICTRDVPKPCRYRYTEEERIADQASDQYGAILNGMYLHKTYQKKKEDNKNEGH